jgi:aromatic ring-cleaving dioxygenase
MNGPHIQVLDYTVANDGAETVLAVTVHEGRVFNLHFDAQQFRGMVKWLDAETRRLKTARKNNQSSIKNNQLP